MFRLLFTAFAVSSLSSVAAFMNQEIRSSQKSFALHEFLKVGDNFDYERSSKNPSFYPADVITSHKIGRSDKDGRRTHDGPPRIYPSIAVTNMLRLLAMADSPYKPPTWLLPADVLETVQIGTYAPVIHKRGDDWLIGTPSIAERRKQEVFASLPPAQGEPIESKAEAAAMYLSYLDALSASSKQESQNKLKGPNFLPYKGPQSQTKGSEPQGVPMPEPVYVAASQGQRAW
ncbi:hypothetical protein FisN_23Lu038 [Fistulifera solaris]|uniref:Uncharacterized protein n=1 Tax=Fistulifera solaris TaxID=1519565 RepID=A0A1Z5KK48_FISSO|nr:hypothetical protein FisN_23Lu038 [Fistulifera solaris]|eukprot:GAX26495.1 hypothetical protein FisN_23Lu038 [Fistulifera solaris]